LNQVDPDTDSDFSLDAVDNLPFNFGYLVEAGFINFYLVGQCKGYHKCAQIATLARHGPGERQSQLQLIQKEGIFFSGYGTKIPSPDTQILYPVK